MNKLAVTSEVDSGTVAEFDRRIYRREFRALLGWGETWFRRKVSEGVIPRGNVDPGGRREWWTLSVVATTLRQLNEAAQTAKKAA